LPSPSSTLRPPPTPTLFPYTTLFRSLLAALPDLSPLRQALCPGGARLLCAGGDPVVGFRRVPAPATDPVSPNGTVWGRAANLQRSEEHTSELQSLAYLVCRLLLEKKK